MRDPGKKIKPNFANSLTTTFLWAQANFFKIEIQKKVYASTLFDQGPSLYYVRSQGWVGGPENGKFPLLYVMKMSLRRWVGGSKKPQNTLT